MGSEMCIRDSIIVAHGSASSVAIKNAINVAKIAYERRLVQEIEYCLEKSKETIPSR